MIASRPRTPAGRLQEMTSFPGMVAVTMPVVELLTLKEIVRETDRSVTTSKGEAVDGQFRRVRVMAGLVVGVPAGVSTVTVILVSAKAREHHRRNASRNARFVGKASSER
jgi:hypothetical protein